MAVYQIIPSTGKFFTFLRDHKADILTYGGIALHSASVVAAAVGTKHLMEEKEKINKEPAVVKRVLMKGKHFVAATCLFAGGTVCILKSDGIMKADNKLLRGELAAITAGNLAYRKRWMNKVGEEEEKKVFLDEKTEETEEDGKKKKVKTTSIDRRVCTERYFDRYCSWRADEHGDIDFDMRTIRNVMSLLNNKLRGAPEKMVFLNDAYDMLGLYVVNPEGQNVDDRTVAGQVAGWLYDKDDPVGDNTIMIKATKTHRRLEDGRVIPTILMEFNIDGNIVEPARERGLIG